MTIAGLLGVVSSTPIGWLADRAGPRATFGVLLTAQAVASFAYAAVHGMALFLLVAGVAQVASSGSGGPRAALVLGLAGDEDRLPLLGQLRAISHIGWAAGAVLGGVALSLDDRPAFLAVLAVNGVSYLVYAGLVATVPEARRPCTPPPSGVLSRDVATARADVTAPGRPMTVLGDRPYLALAALMGILALCWALLSTALPLWVTLHTHAPHAISAAIVLVSALAIAALQVPANRGIRTPRRAAAGAVAAGLALAGSCLLFALTAGMGGAGAIALMLGGAVLHITGELLFVAASWGLSVPLMPPEAPGEYQGVFAAGEAAALMAAPVLMTTLIAGWGQPGWFVLAAIFLVPAAVAVPATRWALRTRPASSGLSSA